MTLINIPIGRGTTRSNFQKKDDLQLRAQSEGQWLNALANQGKIHDAFGQGSQSSTLVSFTPNNGITLYLLEASYTFETATTTNNADLQVTIGGVTNSIRAGARAGAGPADLTVKGFSLVGNNTDLIRIQAGSPAGTYTGTLVFYLENTKTTSSRGGTVIE